MQVMADIRRLWTLPFAGADILAASNPDDSFRKPQFSVMLLDCARLRWDIRELVAKLDRGELSYEQLMHEMAVAKQVRAGISPVWNSLERYEDGRTALVHYTDMPTQPWVSRDNPLCYLWVRDLLEAIDSGFISLDYVRDHVKRGWVRPSLVYQIEHRIEDSLLLSRKARALDESFAAPYATIPHAAMRPARRRDLFWLKTHRRLHSVFTQVRHSLIYRTKLLFGHVKQ